MKNEITKVDPKEFGLAENQASELMGNLPQILKERELMEQQYKEVIKLDIDSPTTIKQAKSVRLLLQKNRTQGINVWHKTNKEVSLRLGQFLDAMKNKEVAVNQRMEATLMEIEKNAEIKEAKRIAELDESRLIQIKPFLHPDAQEPINLGSMQDDVWSNYLLGAESSHKTRIAEEKREEEERIAAEKKAEEERIEKERLIALKNSRNEFLKPYWSFVPENHPAFETLSNDEWVDFTGEMKSAKEAYDKKQAEIAKENERLKKEAELKAKKEEAERIERERLAKIEADKRLKEEQEAKRIQEEKEAKIKADAEAKLKAAELERLRIEKEAKEKQDKLEAELKAKKEAEKKEADRLAKIEADKKESIRLAELAPEKEKIQKWIDSIELPKLSSSEFSKEGEAVVDVIKAKFEAFKKWAESQKETIK